MTRRVLLVDDDAAVREALSQTLELNDLEAVTAGSFVAAKDLITPEFDGVILSDIRMPGRDGFHLLTYAHEIDAELPVILLTGEGDIPMAVRAMSEGAFDFLEKPCAPGDLLSVLERARKTRALVLENRRLKRQLEAGDPAARMLFGTSPQAEQLRTRVRAVAPTGAEVLVTGPAGSGVSKVAEVIHLMSPRAQGAFVKRPAAGMTIEAFDALCQDAAGGSLFLDEIPAMADAVQYAVLERLEQGVAARVIAGTTSDLAQLATSGAFNADLFYRLDGMRVRIPSLAERPEDIPVLFRHYVAQAAEQAGIAAPEISQEHLAMLMAQDWPGNARSLMSAAMRFVLGMPEEVSVGSGLGLAEQMAQVERSLLIAALGRQNGRASAAAAALKLPRKTFYDKLARYGIRPEDYRRASDA
ncbi:MULTISPECIES: sigma-54-dependent transcriptional regulator [Rhodobacterales]|jgi:two-component system C4-dicarboxylate transport response regulator DctD|uniref:Chemotaxis protein CheY n=1 Tax=Phaeobacter gallaeciensis TaxID=60890 RepID=A0A1B0ZWA7_9RHOB|nr:MULTISPECIES: sigma-54 dependent transcriptional regulator [Phaeobacter]MDF1770506.1 sigma-54 dependent transcriptional regulator [Pseudophaeobacter sp. bin_em_oilr2.035]ANP38557.1 chemotaxis protein CheY [Phaeobacter gallaeciensis]MDE4060107.1 sigma-54 dependent transcriptional regulator [Phaeobacter gallaeciensis]MDE4123126.1 sigma-54 dependent transcriptional regulator [Phaeobacter gallaeciensis]MDE4127758.1 sigma-54 dependent transcriptional regulator [Phaeobacter gallaeciensis]